MSDRQPNSVQEKLVAVEAELSFQGDTVQQLNAALADQQRDLLLLQRQVALLGEELAALKASAQEAAPAPADEPPPPHY